eukprot:3936953-Pleurochrysis_carterae.AAC.3
MGRKILVEKARLVDEKESQSRNARRKKGKRAGTESRVDSSQGEEEEEQSTEASMQIEIIAQKAGEADNEAGK